MKSKKKIYNKNQGREEGMLGDPMDIEESADSNSTKVFT